MPVEAAGRCGNDQDYQSFDAFKSIPRLDLPVYFFNVRKDYNTPLLLIERYFKVLEAPYGKELVIFDSSSHTPFLGEAEKFNQELIHVKSETYHD